jgi:hypothetical protein
MLKNTYSSEELREAAIIYFLRDNLEKNKTKIELIKLLESGAYPRFSNILLNPFEYLGDVEQEIKEVNNVFRYLKTDYHISSKQDWRNFIAELINNFCLTFHIKSISDNNRIYYYIDNELDCIN